jgi:excisionase family DNA binding protein
MTALLTKADAAKILGVTPATVAEMERAGKLPAQRTVGGVRLFRDDDVRRLAAERRKRGSGRDHRSVR